MEGEHPEDKGPIVYSRPGLSPNWQESKEYAETKGGRLLTSKELNEFVNTIHRGKSLVKGGAWTATTGKDGAKDWVYIGDETKSTKPGLSHMESGGYP